MFSWPQPWAGESLAGHFQGEHGGMQGKLAGSMIGVLAPQARMGWVRPQPQTQVAVYWLQLEGHKLNTRGDVSPQTLFSELPICFSATWTGSSPSFPHHFTRRL